MTVRVLYFSSLQDIVGQSEAEETLTDDREWTLGDFLDHLYARTPALREWDGSILLAIDQRWANREALLSEGAEIAIMPPVQGG
ncbi:MAG: MoaD/ThiS family protein [Verrucomicrobiae bacterium]|nr:MoaD/ThiS family protein [Verrucomicrobiae bacterium]